MFRKPKCCGSCSFWAEGLPPDTSHPVVSFVGSKLPIGECKKKEFKSLPRTWFGWDCGGECERYVRREEDV